VALRAPAAAIESGQIVVHHRPAAALKGSGERTTTRREALIRWQRPKYGLPMARGLLPPAQKPASSRR
jgi:EAL domain-containing protein (putative c-di-GMP-specific phosphodiesterase class I)